MGIIRRAKDSSNPVMTVLDSKREFDHGFADRLMWAEIVLLPWAPRNDKRQGYRGVIANQVKQSCDKFLE